MFGRHAAAKRAYRVEEARSIWHPGSGSFRDLKNRGDPNSSVGLAPLEEFTTSDLVDDTLPRLCQGSGIVGSQPFDQLAHSWQQDAVIATSLDDADRPRLHRERQFNGVRCCEAPYRRYARSGRYLQSPTRATLQQPSDLPSELVVGVICHLRLLPSAAIDLTLLTITVGIERGIALA